MAPKTMHKTLHTLKLGYYVPFVFMAWDQLICYIAHSLIRGILIQSCSAGAKLFTNYVFCHPQFSGVIQNIENCCAKRAKFWKIDFWLYKIDYFDNNQHRQTGGKMAQRLSIFRITPLNCGWQNT